MSELQKLTSRYRAVVENTKHPLNLYMVQIRLLGLWDDLAADALPWAEYELPLGARANSGVACPAEKGDLVWVEFEHGDSRAPVITGSCQYAPNKVPNLPHEAFAGQSKYQHKRGDDEPKPDAPNYHQNTVLSLNGVLVEIEKSGAYRLTQKASGSAIEIAKGGQIVIHGESDLYLSATGKMKMKIKGDMTVETEGNYNFKAGGKISFEAGGAYSFKGASASWTLG